MRWPIPDDERAFPCGGGGRTYQVSSHSRGVPLYIDGPQEAQQQGVTHPLAAVVAAVALPATAKRGRTHSNTHLSSDIKTLTDMSV